MTRIIGVIYPVPQEFVSRFFDRKTRVFVKFLPHNSTKVGLRNKVIFYASRGQKELVGEGTIEKVDFLTSDQVLSKYKDELFLTESELHEYAGLSSSRSPTKEMLVLVLKNLKEYRKSIPYNGKMTMAGQYVDVEEYNSLINKKRG